MHRFLRSVLSAALAGSLLLSGALLTGCDGSGETETTPETVTETEPYDYASVSYAAYDALRYPDTDLWAEEAILSYRDLRTYVNENRGRLTQAELDAAVEAMVELEEDPVFRQADVAQVYITAPILHFTKTEYTSTTVIVVGPEGKGFKTIVGENTGIKLHGNSTNSSSFPRRPYTIKFEQGQNVLGMGKAKKWVLLPNLFDATLLRNRLVSDFSKDSGHEFTLDTQMAEVWINGNYQGLYLFCEKIDASDYADNLDYENGDALLEWDIRTKATKSYVTTSEFGQRVEINAPEDMTAAQVKGVRDKLNAFEKALKAKDWETLKTLIDVDTFVNYYVMCEYFKPVDFNIASNWYYLEDGILNAGPVWDFDLAMGNVGTPEISFKYLRYNNLPGAGNGTSDSTQEIYCDYSWFGTFLQIPEFNALVTERFLALQPQIVNLYEDNALGKNRIDALLEEYGEAIGRSWDAATWPMDKVWSIYAGKPRDTYEENVEWLRAWLRDRNEWLLREWCGQ
jgi:hypothetical protein